MQTDILLGLLKLLQQRRPSLKIVIMSATLDTDMYVQFFDHTNILRIPGRQYPVEVFYLKNKEADILEAILLTCIQIHEDVEDNGGVLVFLPGQEDIEGLAYLLQENLVKVTSKLKNHKMKPLHSGNPESIVWNHTISKGITDSDGKLL